MQGFRLFHSLCCLFIAVELAAGKGVPPSAVPVLVPAPAPSEEYDYGFHHGGRYTNAVPALASPKDLSSVSNTAATMSPAAAPATAPMAMASANALNNAAAAPAPVAAAGCNASADSASLLFIQQAKMANFSTKGTKTIMVLSNVTAQTIFFADKPERYAGTIGTDFFSANRMFFSNKSNEWLDAPNAALFGLKGNRPQNNTVVIVTLHDPVYDAEAATLTYNVTFIPQRHVGSIANFYRKHKSMPSFSKVIEKIEGKAFLRDVALFIDNFESTDLLGDPVDNTVIPGAGGWGGCFSGGWGWANGCGGAWW